MKISIIGAGAMGGAMVQGFLKGNVFSSSDITVSNRTHKALDKFSQTGVNITTDNREAAANADIVCVAVKPWIAETVFKEIKPVLDYNRQILMTVVAGLPSEQITEWMKKDDGTMIPLFIVIPNIAIAECSSMTFITPIGADGRQTDMIKSIFDTTGSTLVVEEKLLPAGTILASCGIAYAMRYIRAASEGGVELGFKADDAKNIVLQTVKGAVDLLMSTGNHPEAEIDKVTTPGGITIRGLNAMEQAGFTNAVIRGLKLK
ncbi:pyrroline-5-carboxylate reductase family protein [Xylanibacter muris]|uniref:Pyrroline-5-carboxylate reductase n=1 Tax=Xylanibacter muris TaxID=2736290 RepID=A0ABX2AJE2_9BACT|nr:pyrroline-5-carboxylate reductase [Xylanibacter muris]NPD91145.1 pyrroline-5-carboxylate reductase [Xylanibacter muris]